MEEMGKLKILVINMGDYMKGLVDFLTRVYGIDIVIADSVEDAIRKFEEHFNGVIIAFHPQVNPDTSMGISSGLEMWRRVLKNLNENARRIPIVITVESGFFNTTIELQIKRYGILNPYMILSGKDWDEGKLKQVSEHLRLQ